MRDLTPEECEFIAGGDNWNGGGTPEYPPEIVVVASPPPYYPPPYYPPFNPPQPPSPPPYYDPGSGGGGVTPYDNDGDVSNNGMSSVGESVTPFLAQPHMNPGDVRSLTASEKAGVAAFTHLTPDQLNNVRITAGGQFGAALGWGGNVAATTYSSKDISFNPQFAIQDFSANADTMDLLVHELAHAYQYETIGAGRVLGDQVDRLFISDTYSYSQSELQSVVSNPSLFSSLNVEQQATMTADYYRISNGLTPQGGEGFSATVQQLQTVFQLGR